MHQGLSGAGLKHRRAGGSSPHFGLAGSTGASCRNIDNMSMFVRPPRLLVNANTSSSNTVPRREVTVSRERSIRAFSKLDVVVDVDTAAIQADGEEARDEEGLIANFAETVAQTAAPVCSAPG